MRQNLFIALLVLAAPAAANAIDDAEAFKVARAAFDAQFNDLVSGHGQGTYESFTRDEGAKDWIPKDNAKLEVFFERGKYYVHLTFAGDEPTLSERIIVYDSSVLLTSRFTNRISRTGAEGEVLRPEDGGAVKAGEVRPVTANFRWDVSALSVALLNVSTVLQNAPAGEIKIIRNDENGFVWKHAVNEHVDSVCEFAKIYDYNITKKQIISENRSTPTREVVATWKKDKDLWFIDSLEEQFTSNKKEYKSKLRYHSFEVNPPVDPALFTMSALNLPSGSRIIDRRAGVAEKFHYLAMDDKEIESKLDTVSDQLATLPTTRQSKGQQEGTWLKWAVCVNIVIIALVISLMIMRRKAKFQAQPF